MHGVWRSTALCLIALLTTFAFFIDLVHGDDDDDYYYEIDDSLSVSEFEAEFLTFISTTGYSSGVVSVMIDNDLVYNKGFVIEGVSDVDRDPLKLSPVGRMSQTITAAAVMLLVEHGKLTLNQHIFGIDGILNMVKPWVNGNAYYNTDPRIYDITVDHLLRHMSGWNSKTGPMYDPLLNQYYVSQQYTVPDVAQEMDQKGTFNLHHLIQYMIAQPLDFTPGTQVSYSNFNYAILGRVIEESSLTVYKEYIKKKVLEPCGMWHTRLATQHYYDPNNNNSPKDINSVPQKSFPIFNDMDLSFLESSMGWYSNTIDMLRFFRCLGGALLSHDGTYRSTVLLSFDTVNLMLKQPDGIQDDDNVHSWEAAGLRVSKTGSIWQEGDELLDDQLFYCTDFVEGKHSKHHEKDGRKCYIFMLDGKRGGKLKDTLGYEVKYVHDWPQQNDLFSSDLSDFPYSDAVPYPVIKIRLPEHRLTEYVNAIIAQGLGITWLSGYYDGRSTYFVVIGATADIYYDTYFDSGLSDKSLFRHRIKLEKMGYSLYFLQGYISASHYDAYKYAAVFVNDYNLKGLKSGHCASKNEYMAMLDKFTKKGFMPRVQGMKYKHQTMSVDFIFEKQSADEDYKSYLDFGMGDLSDIVQTNAMNGRILSYLDVTDWHGKPKCSAIFKQTSAQSWFVKREITETELSILLEDKLIEGFLPTLVVGYLNKAREVRYIVVLVQMTALTKL